MSATHRATWALAIAATFFWGSNFNAAGAISSVVPPLTAAAERFDIAVAILLLMRVQRNRAESNLDARDMLVLCLLGLIGVFGFNYAFFTALHTTSALNAALIMALSPLVTLLFSVWLLGAFISVAQIAGLAIAFFGVALVITNGHLSSLHIAAGDIWMLFACTAWSLYTVLVRKYAGHIPSPQQTRWTIAAGALALTAVAFWHEQPLAAIASQTLATRTILLYMGLCGTVLGYLFWLRSIETLGPQRVVVAFNLVPVFTLLVGLVFGHIPQATQFCGMLLVLLGVLISSNWRVEKPVRSHALCCDGDL